jgi:AcrR family transcriptional regulator
VLELGFYRASSNAIAERAGVTWGVIQYHFGTREALMLAVLEEGTSRLANHLRDGEITADTMTGRVEEFFDILAGYYGSPEQLVFTQVLINLSHDPRTSERTLKTMAEINEAATPELRRLTTQVFAGTGIRRKGVRNLLFHALRGIALSHAMLGASTFLPPHPAKEFDRQRTLMAEALSLLIDQETES